MRLFHALVVSLCLCGDLASAEDAHSCQPGQRRVTVEDAIRMTRLSVSSSADGLSSNVAIFSPDGTHFALVLKRGNVQHNTNEYMLEIFRTANAWSAQMPEAIVQMESSSNGDAIGRVKWLRDNHTILFIGEMPETNPQIYSFDLKTKRLGRITHHASPIISFDASDDGRVIVFEADPPSKDVMNTPEAKRTGLHITGEDLSEVLLSGSPYAHSRSRESRQLFLLHRGRKPRRIPLEDTIWPYFALSVSPNGQYALVEAFVRDVPTVWRGYKDRLLHEFIVADKPPSSFSTVERYLMLDTTSGAVAPLIDAPKSWEHDGFVWLGDGQSIVLSRAYLPLDGANAAEQEKRAEGRSVVEVALPSRSITKITGDSLVAEAWVPESSVLLLNGRDQSGGTAMRAYRKRGETWEEVPHISGKSLPSNPVVTYEQGMNTPPKIWITTSNDKRRLLLDPNPWFRELCFAKEQEITWTATDGHPMHGGLYLPPGYQPNHRYPLVIQTHGFDPKQFWIDGPWSSAFAAQPLAARDVVVLQIGGSSDGEDARYRSTPQEAPRQMAAFEGAIDSLDRLGAVDRNRVGIIGFSRTVYHVAYTLTHSNYSFAAATLADGFNGGYFEQVAYQNQTTEPNAVNGVPPYGVGLLQWMKRSPAFNLANVKTPVRLESYGVPAAIEEWEWFSLSSQMHKPVDFVLLPRGTHVLVKPWERLVSEQGNVDWFAFWLNGDKDTTPDKRYTRLRDLRESH